MLDLPDTVVVTGSEGLIGTALISALASIGLGVRRFDRKLITGGEALDVLDAPKLASAVAGCVGIIHLAAVSRVVQGERDPDACWRTNVEGTRNVLRAAHASPRRPWVILASSREVYGQPDVSPVDEDAPRCPVNIYGRAKAAAEQLCLEARADGLQTAVMRLSSVYGSIHDHADRVVPCFAARAVRGEILSVEGRDHTFDFTHLEDTIDGILRMIAVLTAGEQGLPPIHFCTGESITLWQLASWAIELAGGRGAIFEATPRSFDVARFCGNPRRAQELLGWRAQIPLRKGLAWLVADFARAAALAMSNRTQRPMATEPAEAS